MVITFGTALFAGGKSRRMGRDKALLALDGTIFLDRIAAELGGFEERLLSVDREERYENLPWRHVSDRVAGCGPLGGLCAVLSECRSDALLVVTCDMPLYEARLGQWLCSKLEEPWDAVVPKTQDGIHPMCAVYRKRCLPVLEGQLSAGDFRLRKALDSLVVRYVDAEELGDLLCNVNTPEEYQTLLDRVRRSTKQ